jgi:hypothetical protein
LTTFAIFWEEIRTQVTNSRGDACGAFQCGRFRISSTLRLPAMSCGSFVSGIPRDTGVHFTKSPLRFGVDARTNP